MISVFMGAQDQAIWTLDFLDYLNFLMDMLIQFIFLLNGNKYLMHKIYNMMNSMLYYFDSWP